MTARTTSPFFTVPPALASRMCAVMTSPIPAWGEFFLPMTPIIFAMRAPVLSATSSLERIWSIKRGADYTSMLENFNQTPALQLGKRAGLGDANGVAHLRLAFFVVSVETLHLLDDLAKLGVWHAGGGLDDGGLRHLGRNDLADALLAEAAGRRGFSGGCGSGLAHGLLGCGRSGLLLG